LGYATANNFERITLRNTYLWYMKLFFQVKMKTINALFIVLCTISLLLCIYSNEKGYLFPFVKGQVKLNENSNLRQAILPQVVQINNGSTFHLSAGKVLKNINGNNVVMFGFNGQVPGPIIKVKQGSTIFVNFTNNLDMDSSIHWHGLKLNNKYDGVPGLTQAPVKPDQSFLYKLDFPNEKTTIIL
jgi:FtsP/CotA-like multicopper oxidase with cupredoxin domain